jgi:hypothetical protein
VILYGLGIKKEGKYADEILGATVSPSSMDDEEQAAAKSTGGMLGGIGKMANMVSGKTIWLRHSNHWTMPGRKKI